MVAGECAAAKGCTIAACPQRRGPFGALAGRYSASSAATSASCPWSSDPHRPLARASAVQRELSTPLSPEGNSVRACRSRGGGPAHGQDLLPDLSPEGVHCGLLLAQLGLEAPDLRAQRRHLLGECEDAIVVGVRRLSASRIDGGLTSLVGSGSLWSCGIRVRVEELRVGCSSGAPEHGRRPAFGIVMREARITGLVWFSFTCAIIVVCGSCGTYLAVCFRLQS